MYLNVFSNWHYLQNNFKSKRYTLQRPSCSSSYKVVVYIQKLHRFCNTSSPDPIYPTSPLGQDMTQGQILSGVWRVWIQSFPSPRLVASPKLKNLVSPTILPIAGGRIIGFIPFPRLLVLCEMQSVSSRIWTRVAVSISYDDNNYTTGTPSPDDCPK